MKDMMNWLANEEDGQGMVEYGLILALVAVAAIAVLGPLGKQIKAVFKSASDELAANGVAVPTT